MERRGYSVAVLLTLVNVSVGADHSQYAVADLEADSSRESSTGGTGFIGPQGDVAVVCTGTEDGPVRLTVESHDGPPDLDLDAWDEVVDISLELPSGTLVVQTLLSGNAATVDLPTGDGIYWLRAYARGRDDARIDPEDDHGRPVEEHRFVTWPADPEPDMPHAVVHKATDMVGAYHRQQEERKRTSSFSTIEFRTVPAQWSVPEWAQWPESGGVPTPLAQPVYRSDRLTITTTELILYPTGCLIHLHVHSRRGDLEPDRWQRVRDVVSHGFGFPGHSLRRPVHPDALKLSVAWEGRPPVLSAKARRAAEGRPEGPTLVGYWAGALNMADHVEADHKAWLWPRPPVTPLQFTIEWPALDVPPTPFTLDTDQSPDA
jgi:hypothetical protein